MQAKKLATAPGICVKAKSNNRGETAFEVLLWPRSESNLHGLAPFLLCQVANIHIDNRVSMHRYRPVEGKVIYSEHWGHDSRVFRGDIEIALAHSRDRTEHEAMRWKLLHNPIHDWA